jgi:hypothetical protein
LLTQAISCLQDRPILLKQVEWILFYLIKTSIYFVRIYMLT